MNLKPGYIYIVKTNWGEVFDGEFVSGVRTVNVFSRLPFVTSKDCPNLVDDEDIDWVEPICEMTPHLTESQYKLAISEHKE